MKIGRTEEALLLAERPVKEVLKDSESANNFSRLAKLIRGLDQPKEILDVSFVREFIYHYLDEHESY